MAPVKGDTDNISSAEIDKFAIKLSKTLPKCHVNNTSHSHFRSLEIIVE